MQKKLVNGELLFNEAINAPKIFGEDPPGKVVQGKYTYDGNLGFQRHGDTYTIFSAEVMDNTTLKRIDNLDKFKFLKDYANDDYANFPLYDWETGQAPEMKVISNSFWPFDDIYNLDPHTGVITSDYQNINFNSYNDAKNPSAPGDVKSYWFSDDGTDHNNLFGMEFSIEFNVPDDYLGPMEYTFYGDDDLWVFLDGELIIDIGGVHSSIGEKADLWDYLRDPDGTADEGKHTLNVFYTERGLYGSCCYMSFTLPSAHPLLAEQNTNC